MNVIAELEFERIYGDLAIKHVNHFAMRTPHSDSNDYISIHTEVSVYIV